MMIVNTKIITTRLTGEEESELLDQLERFCWEIDYKQREWGEDVKLSMKEIDTRPSDLSEDLEEITPYGLIELKGKLTDSYHMDLEDILCNYDIDEDFHTVRRYSESEWDH